MERPMLLAILIGAILFYIMIFAQIQTPKIFKAEIGLEPTTSIKDTETLYTYKQNGIYLGRIGYALQNKLPSIDNRRRNANLCAENFINQIIWDGIQIKEAWYSPTCTPSGFGTMEWITGKLVVKTAQEDPRLELLGFEKTTDIHVKSCGFGYHYFR